MTLETIITELTALAATNGSPAHVARYVLALAQIVAEMRQAVEDNARLAGHEARRFPSYRAALLLARERIEALAANERLAADRDDAARALANCRAAVDDVTDQRDAALRLAAIHRDERDSLAADVQRLTSQREAYREQRDALEGDVRRLNCDVADWKTCCNRLEAEAEKLRTSAESVERDVVERIAKWLDKRARQLDPESFANPRHVEQHAIALDNATDALRSGTWKETAQ